MTSPDVRIERLLAQPVDRVWAAWTEPRLMARWFCPNAELALSAAVDLRVGGGWQVRMGPFTVGGDYHRVDAPHELAFSWRFEHEPDALSTVRVSLHRASDATQLVLVHEGSADEDDVRGHAEGWNLQLDRLEGLGELRVI